MDIYIDKLYASLPLIIRNKIKRLMMALLERKLKRFYGRLIKSGNLVYDIGANEGDYTKIFRDLGANVVSIEPHPQYCKDLAAKFKNDKSVTIIKAGLGQKTGYSDFYISSFNSPNSTFSDEFRKNSRYSYRKWDRVIKVRMTTLKRLIEQYGLPDFCKIDVEGYELEVLSTLKKPVPALSFEFLTEMNNRTFEIIKYLERLGKGHYNICLGMKYKYLLNKWINASDLISFLKSNQQKMWNGDIYVKFDKTG